MPANRNIRPTPPGSIVVLQASYHIHDLLGFGTSFISPSSKQLIANTSRSLTTDLHMLTRCSTRHAKGKESAVENAIKVVIECIQYGQHLAGPTIAVSLHSCD